MRKRMPVIVGGGAALLVIGSYLNFGVGFREGGTETVDPDAPPVEITDDVAAMTDSMPIEPPVEEVLVPAEPTTPDVVDVLIVDDRYMVIDNAAKPDDRIPMTLDEIVAMVDRVPGETSGIKVRIARTPSAIAIAEAGLTGRLINAGVNEDQIDARRQLVQ